MYPGAQALIGVVAQGSGDRYLVLADQVRTTGELTVDMCRGAEPRPGSESVSSGVARWNGQAAQVTTGTAISTQTASRPGNRHPGTSTRTMVR